jgi:cystathionine beta-lyase
MNSSFDQEIDRMKSGSMKWDAAAQIFGQQDILPLWVADMDFAIARPITEAIVRRAEHAIYGYPAEADSLKQAVVERIGTKFNWRIEKDWLVFSTGIVHALHMIVMAFTKPGDGVILQPPVYYPFFSAITNNGCTVIENPLVNHNGTYRMDFGGLQAAFKPGYSGLRPKPSRARLLLLCSPHNPVGRVWSREELEECAKIVIENEALIVSDEIHGELVFKGSTHIPTATLSEEIAHQSITCFSASKTFNLAGLKSSVLIIPNPKIRRIFQERTAGFLSSPGILGLTAMEAAFRQGDDWLRDLLAYLAENLRFLQGFVENHIPQINVITPQGTYLVWLDFSALGRSDHELRKLLRKKARVGLDDGFLFGTGGEGFQRINIACPRTTLEEALNRIKNAVDRV